MQLYNRIRFLLLAVICWSTGYVYAQPDFSGTEALVNTTTANSQQNPATAMDSSGNYVVVWESFAEDGDDYGIFGQLFDASGTASGSQFQINNTTAEPQRFPDVGMDQDGNFTVVWMSREQDGDGWGVYARRYLASGATNGGVFKVNGPTSGNQRQPKIAMNANGNHVIVYMDETNDGSDYGIYYRRYNASNVTQNSSTLVNTTTADYQGYPDVALDDIGNFAIVWQSVNQDGSRNGIYGQRYTVAGATSGSEFLVNTLTSDNQQEPSVGMDGSGGFVVSWSDYDVATKKYNVFAQQFTAGGATVGSNFQVNTSISAGSNDHSQIAMNREGSFLITWEAYGLDGSFTGVYAQAYDASAGTFGIETIINDRTQDFQQSAAPATHSDSTGWIIAWQDGLRSSTATNDGGDYGIYSKLVPILPNIAPTAICQNITVYLDGAGTATIAAADVDGGSNDGGGAFSLALSQTTFACSDIGSNSVTLTITDAGLATDQCTATVTVEDSTSPTAVCQNITVNLNASGTVSITANDIDGGSTDNCGIASLSASPLTFNCSEVGTVNPILTVTDVNGNTANCTAIVTVQDNIAPTAVCVNLVVNLDAVGSGAITAADVASGSTDNCGIGNVTLSQSAFTCSDIGTNSVLATVTDVNGNISNCTSTVTVQDNIVPTALCQNVTVQLNAAGTGSITEIDVNNGSSDNCSLAGISVNTTSFSCSDIGANTVTLTVTDGSGNVSTCASTVLVEDNIAPTALCQNVTSQLDASGNASITAADVNNGSSDNCGLASTSINTTSFTCVNVGANTVTLTVTDVNGNVSTCTASVTVEDNIAPTAVCQNATVQLDASGNGSIVAADIDGGSTDNCGIASLSASTTSFTCANVGANTVTLTATDVNGNTSTCTASVTVEDNIAPTALCQNITVQLDGSGNASIVAADIDGGSTDNCGIASLGASATSFVCADVGSNTVTLTVTDVNGNVSTCTASVTVEDNVAPTAVCQNVTVQLDASGNASITVADVNNGSSDNCGIASTSINTTSFTCANVGANTVTLTVTDVNGNVSTCTGSVTVEDNIAPTAVCQNATVQLDASGNGSIVVADIDAGSTDNCGIASLSASTTGFTCANVGANTVTLTVADLSGNTATCTATVTVEDNIAPTAVCQNVTVQLDASGNGSITAADVDGGSTDNCGIASLSIDQGNFSCAIPGLLPVTLTVTDVNGNTSSCIATATVVDNIAPTAVCQNVTVQLDASGNGSIVAADIDGGSADNCGIASLSASATSFTCANVGANTVTLTVTDLLANVSTCTATVTVEDNIAPTAVCQNVTVQLDASGNGSITAADVDGGSTDNCGIAGLSIDQGNFSCAIPGLLPVTLTVTDVNGNTSSCIATATVIDNTAPTAVCQNVTVQLDASGNGSITAADIDGGSTDNCGIASLTASNTSFTCANVGANTVTLTVTDVNGNVSTCTASVTVEDNVAPTAVCQNVTVALDASGNGSITASDVDGGSTDNCGIASISVNNTSFTCANVGANTVTLTVTDVNGNSSNCAASVTVEDNVAPTSVCQNVTVALDASGNASITASDVDGGSTDNCGIASLSVNNTSFNCSNVGGNTVTLTVTDVNGNVSTCTSTVTVEDNVAPTAVCQNVTVALDANGNGSITASDVDGGSTDNCGIASITVSNTSFTCANVGANTVTLTVTDVNGNVSTCTASVTVEDNVAPTAVCQNVTVALDASGSGSITASDVDGGSTDNCGIASISVNNTSFNCSNVGANTVTLTVTDVNGNSSTCTASVTVEDNIAPTAVCQNVTVALDASGNGSITASDVDNGSSDNCGIASVTVSNTSFTCTNVGANTVTLTVTDVNGNVSTCTSTVTVEDNVAPTAVCQNVTVALDANGNGSITASDVDGGSTDNCGIASIAVSNTSFTCANVGANTVTLTVTDVNGNVSTCTASVTVEDNVAPTAVCQNVTVALDASGNGSITASDVDNGSSDNCGIASVTVSNTSFTCANVGANTVTLTVTDVNGNVSTCTASVTVEDNVAPTAVCQNVTVALDASGNGSITASDVDGGSTDNCGIASISVSNTSFNCSNVGANTVTLTVTDVNGNVSTCTSTVTVEDNVAPTAVCQNVTVALDANGNGSITASDVDGGSTDNCGIASITVSNTSFTCANVGANTVTLTVTDVNGNVSTCTASVTVEDNVAPTAVCQNVTVALDASGNGSITASDVDGGSTDNCGIASISVSNTSFTCANVGANTVTLTVTDVNGNSSNCTASVTVEDNIAPTAVCQNVTVALDASGNGSITASDVDGGSTDNCGIASISVSNTSFNCSNVGGNTVTLTVTDVNGNVSTCTSTVTVEDNVAPTAVCQNVTVALDANGNGSITASDVDGGSTDNCGIASITVSNTSFTCANVGANTVTLTVTDVNGNVSTCTASVTVEDNVAPTAVCQNVTVALDASGNASITASDVDGGSTDNCGIASISVSNTSFTCANVGANTVTLTVTDVNGNVSTCTSTVTVEDNIAPTAVCQNITVTLDANGNATITASDVDGGSTDNCGIASVSISNTTFNCSNVGPNAVTLTVTDVNGNVSTCTASVTVDENVPPTAVCQNTTVYLDGSGNATISGTDIDGGSTDNCAIASLVASPNTFDCSNVGNNTSTLTVSDVNGNTATCTATVTVIDSVAPNAVCQDITVYLDAIGVTFVTASDLDGGSNDACGIASISTNVNVFGCGSIPLTNTGVLTVTDVNGNVSTCTSNITVLDTVGPTVFCQNITVTLDSTGSYELTNPYDVISGTQDNCGAVICVFDTNLVSQTVFDCNNLGSVIVTITGTDVNGNTGTCTSTVTVTDSIAPVAVCQNATVQLDASGNGSITGADIDGGSTDNCAITLAANPNSFGCADVGGNSVALTVSDASGNTDVCTATVTVEDNVAPVAVCQNITVQLDAGGNALVSASDVDGGSNDACGIASLSVNPQVFNCSNVGANTVTLTVTDVNANVSTCTASVTVEDNVAPTAVCQSVTVQLDANGNGSITAADVDGGSADNCSIASLSVSNTSFTCSDVGANTVTLTVTDINGNVSTCTAAVTVEDNVAPNVICQNTTIQLDANGFATIVPADVDGGSTDACGISLLSIGTSSFNCSNVGSNNVTLLAIDVNGNVASCVATVSVTDNIAPAAVCQNVTVQLDGSGNASVSASDIDGGSTDNCGVASLSLSTTNFTCANAGSNAVTLTVTDLSGNTSTCTSTVTIVDSTAPTAVCQSITVQLDASGNASITASDVDGGSSDNCGIVSSSVTPNAFDCSNIGANTVTLTVADGSGSSATCTATVTVEDNLAPNASCQNNTIFLDANGQVTAVASDYDGGSTDNCGIASIALAQTSFSCADVGNNPIVLTVTDVNGNSATCTATVRVRDNIDPEALCQDVTIQLDANGQATISASDIDDGSTDNCSVNLALSHNNFGCGDIGGVAANGLFFSEYVEGSGREKYLEIFNGTGSTVNLADYEVRRFPNGNASPNANNNFWALSGTLADGAVVVLRDSLATGPGVSVNNNALRFSGDDAVTLFNVVAQTNSDIIGVIGEDPGTAWTAAGGYQTNNRTLRRRQTVTGGITVNPPSGNFAAGFVTLDTEWDLYGLNDLSGLGSHSLATNSSNVVTMTVSDPSNNVDSCTAVVTVEDNIAPTAVCQNITVQLDANASVTIAPADLDGGSNDNCGFSLSATPVTFDCSNIGVINSATLTVADLSGNTATCSATVTVVDTTGIICCPVVFDFEQDDQYNAVVEGTEIDNQWAADGVVISANNNNGPDQAIIFNSAAPTGGDTELGAPNVANGGPGVGSGGASTNFNVEGNILVIARNLADNNNDGFVDVPRPSTQGGTITFDFTDNAATVSSIKLIDVANNGWRVRVTQLNNNTTNFNLSNSGDNSIVDVPIGLSNVTRIQVRVRREGGVVNMIYCPDGPAIQSRLASNPSESIVKGESAASAVDDNLFTAFPNPFVDETTLRFKMTSDEDVSVKIYDMRGILITTAFEGEVAAGQMVETGFHPDQVSDGIYFAKLITKSGVIMTQKLMVRR